MKNHKPAFLSNIVGGSLKTETPNGCEMVQGQNRRTPVSSNWETVRHPKQHSGTTGRDAPDQ